MFQSRIFHLPEKLYTYWFAKNRKHCLKPLPKFLLGEIHLVDGRLMWHALVHYLASHWFRALDSAENKHTHPALPILLCALLKLYATSNFASALPFLFAFLLRNVITKRSLQCSHAGEPGLALSNFLCALWKLHVLLDFFSFFYFTNHEYFLLGEVHLVNGKSQMEGHYGSW